GLAELTQAAYAEDVACTLPPSMAKGPYWVDEKLNRADITLDTDRASVLNGLPLTLNLSIFNDNGNSCGTDPVPNMQIDIWHADAAGEYSDVSGNGQSNTKGQDFLRGFQLTNAEGKVSFKTIYPGWYPSRTVHIHLRARAYDANGNNIYDFATQFFLDDEITDTVYAVEPYNTQGTRDTRNSNDFGYLGVQTPPMLNLVTNDDGSMTGEIVIGLSGVPDNIANSSGFNVSSVNNGSPTEPSINSVLTINPTDIGIIGNIYVLAFFNGSWFINSGQTWSAYADSASADIAAFYTGLLESTHQLTILSGLDVSNLQGARLYVGYGINTQDMLQKSQYTIAYTL
ncbi:hypothetical protein, partial [Candidatus Albibeggiatoa sp. nov. BB20]|uniref:dioxygenase family protein n=1 Tax=Candidatus Albibeggiatoa sp. nov. BB20 TaxID=3162723 RepID=UPI0033655DD2